LKSVPQHYNEWLNQWCKKRIKHLHDTERIKHDHNLLDKNLFTDVKHIEIPNVQPVITDDLIIYVLSLKSESLSYQDMHKTIKSEKNVDISVNMISKIMTGKIKPIEVNAHYDYLISTIHKRTSKKRKIIDEHIYFILDERKKQKTYYEIQQTLLNTFDVVLSRASISDVILGKIKPLVEQSTKPVKEKKPPKSKEAAIQCLTQEQILYLIKAKHTKKTSQEVSDAFKEKYNMYVSRNVISCLWLGQLNLDDNITHSDEYQNMLQNKRKRVKKATFTDEEISFVITSNGSLNDVVKAFNKQFNKTITKTYVSKLKKQSNTDENNAYYNE
jgi:hypothetical protein